MKQRGLAGGIRTDDGRDLGGEAHSQCLGTKTAEAREGNAFETHDALLPLPKIKPRPRVIQA